jgi:hypothetical protein
MKKDLSALFLDSSPDSVEIGTVSDVGNLSIDNHVDGLSQTVGEIVIVLRSISS